jgi:hypothetical protein
LCTGEFVDRSENLLIFGLPGRGKTHFAAAVGHELVNIGRSVFFTPTYRLVDSLLRAKRELLLEQELRILDRFEVLILDDIGYVQQSRDEMEVLARIQAGGRVIACGLAITKQERAAVLAQRFRVYQRHGYYRAGLGADRDVYDTDAAYFLATLPDAKLGDVLLGSARLISASRAPRSGSLPRGLRVRAAAGRWGDPDRPAHRGQPRRGRGRPGIVISGS